MKRSRVGINQPVVLVAKAKNPHNRRKSTRNLVLKFSIALLFFRHPVIILNVFRFKSLALVSITHAY